MAGSVSRICEVVHWHEGRQRAGTDVSALLRKLNRAEPWSAAVSQNYQGQHWGAFDILGVKETLVANESWLIDSDKENR